MANDEGGAQEPDIFEIGNVIDDSYVISGRLGKGGYGEIYRATCIKDGSVVAVKVERASKSGNLFEELNIINTLSSTYLYILFAIMLFISSALRHQKVTEFVSPRQPTPFGP